MIYNPFMIYGLVFTLVCVIYELPFSKLYPELTNQMIIFLGVIIISSFIIGIIKKKRITSGIIGSKEKNNYNFKRGNLVIGIIYMIYILGFIYSKQIPVISNNVSYLNYKGLPVVHVLVFNFNIYYGIYVFYNYLKTKKKKILIQYIILYIPAILLVSRGLIMNIFLGSLFIYLINSNLKITKKKIVGIIIISLTIMYFFGIFGNLRSGPKERSATNSNYIMDIGRASNEFRQSIIPKEFFWTYLYISSPLANFQLNMNESKKAFYTDSDISAFFKNDILLDAISKRLKPAKQNQTYLITPELVVGTMFMESYVDLGVWGIILVYLNFVIFYIIYERLLRRYTIYYKIGIAMLCTLSLLSVFNNMLRFSGMSLQLLYPIIIPFIKRLKFKK